MSLKKLNKKAQLQFPFAWVFAIIVGAIIIFIAIYASTRVINVGEEKVSAELSQEFESLLNPLESGPESGSSISIDMPTETQLIFSCSSFTDFGKQEISLKQKISNKFVSTDFSLVSENKYIFSNKTVQGKKFFVFTKPFEFPFKVADLMYFTSSDESYCFLDAPKNIEREISNLNQENLFVKDCPSNSKKICFKSRTGCNVFVNENLKTVSLEREEVYYETDALLYAAIFSNNKQDYECNVKRLMKRAEILSRIYNEKTNILANQGCISEVNLLPLINSLNSYNSSDDLTFVKNFADDAELSNERARCKLW
ncbi:MAG: hypothetical protein KatS3mg001_433 [Candidatus Pacearchaeota archaeon]|nr:MAG: hypothetical protein KatS3mg001_433 [Candidatus Pacearchaeota archaeon]